MVHHISPWHKKISFTVQEFLKWIPEMTCSHDCCHEFSGKWLTEAYHWNLCWPDNFFFKLHVWNWVATLILYYAIFMNNLKILLITALDKTWFPGRGLNPSFLRNWSWLAFLMTCKIITHRRHFSYKIKSHILRTTSNPNPKQATFAILPPSGFSP